MRKRCVSPMRKMRKQGFQGTNITFLRLFLGEIGDVVPNHSAPPQLKETEKAVRQRKMRKLTLTLGVNGCKPKNLGVNSKPSV